MTTPVQRPVRLSATTTIPIGVVWTVGIVLAAALLYMGEQLQRLDTIDSEVRTMRDELREVRTLLLRQTGR